MRRIKGKLDIEIMKIPYDGSIEFEEIVKIFFEKQGYEVIKIKINPHSPEELEIDGHVIKFIAGAPDYLVKKDNSHFFVECKTGGYTFSIQLNQIVWYISHPNERIILAIPKGVKNSDEDNDDDEDFFDKYFP